MVIAFSTIPEIECLVISDERVAGYFALGMAQQLAEIVAVICTSGTAVLNLFPGVCEAYYQMVSLLIITADRPLGASGRGENQAINQEGIYGVYARCINVKEIENSKVGFEGKVKEISEGIDRIKSLNDVVLQLNVLIDEPLYETSCEPLPKIPEVIESTESLEFDLNSIIRIKKDYYDCPKKMMIIGVREYDTVFAEKLRLLNERKDWILVVETTSNVTEENIVWNIEPCLSILDKKSETEFIPDLVITMGNQIISKKIRQFLKDKPKRHWDIPQKVTGRPGRAMFGDAFDEIKDIMPINDLMMLDVLLNWEEDSASSYKKTWLELSNKANSATKQYLSKIPFSDLKVFQTLVKSFPAKANIQYGNSTPIRYSNFFEHKYPLTVNANRGTSGIDGCVSTAAGAAYVNQQMTICVVGDISFFYDSNSLWNNYLSPDFRIIIINNGGGNIFRWIEGATEVKDFEKFFETKHNLSVKHLASMYGLPYYFCDSQKGLDKVLKTFYQLSDKPKILEVKTDGILSAKVYKGYFDFLKQI